MTDPVLAHQTPMGRMYARSTSSQPEVPSITTVISMEGTDLAGWHSYMAANALIKDERLGTSLGEAAKERALVKEAALASETYRENAARRGDRVHAYAENVAREQLGLTHQREQALQDLSNHGEGKFAQSFDRFWQQYQVTAIAPELTVWNQDVGYAGTLDLVATIGKQQCLIDFKTKGENRDGQLKSLDPKVVMQLVAGLKAGEQLVDASSGEWAPFAFSDASMLLAITLGENQVRVERAQPQSWKSNWRKFWSLRHVWQSNVEIGKETNPLSVIGPPRSQG